MEKITHTKKLTEGHYKIYYYNGVIMGDLLKDVDGYFYYWPIKGRYGSIAEHHLLAIASELHELNKEWYAIIQADPNII